MATMPTVIRHLLPFALLLGPCASLAADSICTSAERSVWECRAGKKQYAICASSHLDSSSGYMQYRVMKGGKPEFAYPTPAKHPKGVFRLELLPRGASLTFHNAAYQYTIYEPLIGPASVHVEKAGKSLADITCATATEGLTLTTTQTLLSQVGVYRPLGVP